MKKPLAGEFNPYFNKYIDLIPQTEITSEMFDADAKILSDFFRSIPSEKHNYRYAEYKWTVKEVLLHIVDTERVMSYRALAALRGDDNSLLPTMNENVYAKNAHVTNRPMDDILIEFNAVRIAAKKLFESATEAQGKNLGKTVPHPVSARALAYIILGHGIHHVNVVKEKYL